MALPSALKFEAQTVLLSLFLSSRFPQFTVCVLWPNSFFPTSVIVSLPSGFFCICVTGVSPSELRVNGNVSLSNWLMQRLADVTNIPVQRSEFIDSSCLGAAITAGVGAGTYSSLSLPHRF